MAASAARGSYPLPDVVAGYGTASEFAARRQEAGGWVFWEDRVELILAGRYREVKPLHVELAPTYLCNFSCPWCSCRTARETWSDDDVSSHPKASDATVMTTSRMANVLEHLAEHNVGIQWVGGEPTIYPALYPAAERACELGLKQCLFTNGAALSPKRILALYDAGLVFVRVSLNAVTKEVHRRHHDYRADRNYDERVLRNTRDLVRLKRETGAKTMVGISVVVDERNLCDVIPTAQYIVDLCEEFGSAAVDFAIFRPTYQFYDAQLELTAGTGNALRKLVETGSVVEELLQRADVAAVVPQESFRAQDFRPEPGLGGECLGAAMFGEVTPTGELLVCSDRYGNPDYVVGNLADSSFEELWHGEKRSRVFDRADAIRCFATECPRNGRGFFFNRIFHSVERFRRQGRIDEVRAWVSDLREVLPRPEHSFFI